MSSEAEERIRAKAVDALRAIWPEGRIVHELVLQQGGCRIDLACVMPARIVVVEVKSERDVLDRLALQAKQARPCADAFFTVLAEKHWRKAWEEKHICILEAVREDDAVREFRRGERSVMAARCNAPARLSMLWANELRRIAGLGSRSTREAAITHAADTLTGAEVRKAVCAAIRARSFPRADPPVLSDLFPEVSRFHA